MRAALTAGACAVLLVLTGCTETSGSGMDEREQQNAELRKRPTSEAEVARLTEAQEAVRTRLTADLPLGPWTRSEPSGSAGCAEYDQADGQTVFLPGLLLQGGVPDDVWPRAVEVLQNTAAGYGFGTAEVVVDRPDEHEVVLRGERGALLRFGTLANATLQVESGCHLPERVHGAAS